MNSSHTLKNDWILTALMICLVPLAGEIKLIPFDSPFRVSFGSICFFLLLLLLKTPPVVPALLTAAAVLIFRVTLDAASSDVFHLASSIRLRFPAFCYYVTFGILVQLFNLRRFDDRPWLIGLWGVLFELVSTHVELFMLQMNIKDMLSFPFIIKITIIAFIRSFFVLSFFSMLELYKGKIREKQVQQKNEHLLILLSDLYEEAIHLKKTLHNAELITKNSYDLYRELKKREKSGADVSVKLSPSALRIAGDVHEIKKDNQRIYAGLSKVISNEGFQEYKHARELIQLMININQKYAASLQKEITFTSKIESENMEFHVYTILSIINNLLANSVEAIKRKGFIQLVWREAGGRIECSIEDDGPGVPEQYQEVIFQPGFTSKYNQAGVASTGIGLSYVKETVTEFGGDIHFYPKDNGAIFSFTLPIKNLTKKE